MWNGAMAALQQGLKPTDNSSKTLDGNYNAQLTECQRIQADQVKTYGDNDIFDIQALQDKWSGGQVHADSLNCKKTIYGVFATDGTTNGRPAPMSSSEYWNALQADCNTSLGTDTFKDGTKLTDVLQNSFSLVSDPRGLGTTVKFNFSCVPQKASTYTQCKLPGFDQLKGDATKGWVVNDSSCTQNPLVIAADAAQEDWKPTCTNTFNDCNGDKTNDQYASCGCTEKDTSTCCPKGTSLCTGDNRPQDRYSTKCCVNCANWQTDATTYGQFSAFDAQDTNTTSKIGGKTYHDIIHNACFGNSSDSSDSDTQSHGCCLKTTTLGDTQSGQNCENCQRFASKIDMSDSNHNKILFHLPNQSGDDQTLKYVDDPNGNGLGVAITPTGGSGGTPSTFADVRECKGGSADGICRGLTGCAGMLPPNYCFDDLGSCEHNVCNAGLNYTDQSNIYGNPSTNCPNVYTLSRNLDSTCPSNYNYDDTTKETMRYMKKLTIPEGAWVTGYQTNKANWNVGTGMCSNDDNTTNVIMMGCGKETTTNGVQVTAHASEYTVSNGNWTLTNPDSSSAFLNKTSYDSSKIKRTITDSSGKSCDSTGNCNEAVFCTFEPKEDDGDGLKNYQAYTFGFMPGYYNSKYTTSTGPCGGQS